MDVSSGFWLLVDKFISVIENETGFPVVIYDSQGCIIKATDQRRIGTTHSGAQRIMICGLEEYTVSSAEAQANQLVREGYSLPIYSGEDIIGGFGITGKVELARPIAKVAVQMIEAWLREQEYIEKLSRSEIKYRRMFDQSLNGIFQSTLEGRVLKVNRASANILGYDDEETVVRNLNDVATELYVDPQDRQRFIDLIQKNGSVRKFETKFKRYGGRIIDISLNGKLLYDLETGKPYIQGYLIDITSRKRAEEKLRISENNLRITLESIGDGVITTDTEGRIVLMNATAGRLTCCDIEKVCGRSLEEVYHVTLPDSLDKRYNPAIEILERKRRQEQIHDAILAGPGGREYRIAESGAPIIDPKTGAIQGAVIVFRDVSEAYAQAERIRLSEQRLKHITANIPGVVFRLNITENKQFNPDYLSEQFRATFGLNPEERNVDKLFLASMPEEDAAELLFSLEKAVEQRREWHFEGRFLKPDGATLWFSANAVPQEEANEIAYYGVFMDITDRKNWENTLAASERRFRELFNDAPVMYVITEIRDNDWYILEANTTFLDLLGYRPAEVVDTPLRNYFSEESKTSFFGNPDMSPLDYPAAQECSLIAKDGSIVYSLLKALPEIDENGTAWGSRSMFLDITARKKAEDEAQRLQKALAQAQKMEAIGTLAGGIAHDFNNILSAVIGFSQLSLYELPKDCPSRNYVSKIIVAGERAKDLVNQILAFSRQSKITRMPMQVEPLLKESLQLLRATLPATIDIVKNIESPLDNIHASPIELQQIILNLCTNAFHAMEKTGGTLTISLNQLPPEQSPLQSEHDRQSKSCLCLTVSDTGTGIKKSDLDRIFEPYYTTKKKNKGTGLGLSVIHGIVKEYQGKIEVASTVGAGTSFTLYLPATSIDTFSKEASTRNAVKGGTERIILVDDEPVILEIAQDMLTRLGYTVDAFDDCEKALQHFQKHSLQYSILIVDYVMPKLNGVQLYEKMCKYNPNLRVLVWSGTQHSKINLPKKFDKVKALLEKPSQPEKLAQKVRELLDRE